MAYNPNQPHAKYVATAGQTVFNYLFKIFLNTDLVVYQVADGDDPELAVPLLLDVDYAVTINGDDGGSIELTSGAALDDNIIIYRRLGLTRYVEYQQSGDLLASTLNNDQDYQTYLIADLEDQVNELLSGDLPGSTADYVRKTGDTMTGALNLASGGSGVQAIQAQEVITITDANAAAIDNIISNNYGIESGSNANGEYTKFPDGTLICTGTQTLPAISHTLSIGSLFRSGATAIYLDWSHSFVGEYAVTANLSSDTFVSDDFIGIQQVIRRDEHYGHVITLTATSGDKDVVISFQAIGRWK